MTTFQAKPEQILEGAEVSHSSCTVTGSDSGEVLREGDRVIIHIDRYHELEAWGIVGVYKADTYRDVELHGKNDHDEILAKGRLAVASDMATQEARLVIVDVNILNSRHVGEPRCE